MKVKSINIIIINNNNNNNDNNNNNKNNNNNNNNNNHNDNNCRNINDIIKKDDGRRSKIDQIKLQRHDTQY